MLYSEYLKSRRLQLGLSRFQVAVAVGCVESSVRNWESGVGLPRVEFVKPLARLYGIEPAELLDRLTDGPPVVRDVTQQSTQLSA